MSDRKEICPRCNQTLAEGGYTIDQYKKSVTSLIAKYQKLFNKYTTLVDAHKKVIAERTMLIDRIHNLMEKHTIH